MSFKKCVSNNVGRFIVDIFKPSTYDVFVDEEWVFSNNSLINIQSELFEYFLKKLPETERTTENVMKLYFDVQLLVDICRQEFKGVSYV